MESVDVTNKPSYMPQLDGLRALAISAVVVHHSASGPWPLGGWGVTLFFVISGYLITGSILALKDEGKGLGAAALNFFLKRSLRLFPAYYLMLLIACIAWQDVRQDLVWYATYTSNILLAIRADWLRLTPTWSLAIEEQFYLVWFFVALLLPPRGLKITVCALIVLGPLTRFLLLKQGAYFSVNLIAASADALAVGAGLCLLERSGRQFPLNGIAVLGLFALLLVAPLFIWKFNPYFGAIGQSTFVLVSGYLVWWARRDSGSIPWVVLGHPVVVWLGKISYGVYLYSIIVPGLLKDLGLLAAVPGLQSGFGQFAAETSITIAIAALSYHYFETPIRYGALRRLNPRPAIAGKAALPVAD